MNDKRQGAEIVSLFPQRQEDVDQARQGPSDSVDELLLAVREAAATAESIEDEADRAALDSETVFLERFGFDAPRHRRQQVLTLKHEADLTDREIRWLRRVRCLAFTGSIAEISAPAVLAFWGYVQLAIIAGLMLYAFVVALGSTQPAHIVMAKIGLAEALMLAFAVAVVYQFIWPRQLLKRVQAKQSGATA